jgi:hypothetical protein
MLANESRSCFLGDVWWYVPPLSMVKSLCQWWCLKWWVIFFVVVGCLFTNKMQLSYYEHFSFPISFLSLSLEIDTNFFKIYYVFQFMFLLIFILIFFIFICFCFQYILIFNCFAISSLKILYHLIFFYIKLNPYCFIAIFCFYPFLDCFFNFTSHC